MSLKIVQLIPELDTGGAERTSLDISAALINNGDRSLILTRGGRLCAQITDPREQLALLDIASKNPWVMAQNIGRIEKLARSFDANILHARSRAPAWSAYFAARRLGAGFVTTYHGTYAAKTMVKRAYNAIMAKGDLVIANSKFIAKHIEETHQIDPQNIRVIPRGLDLGAFDPAVISAARRAEMAGKLDFTSAHPLLVMPGRLSRWKGQLVMVEAVAQLRERGILVNLALPGDAQGRNAYVHEINAKISALALNAQICVPGHIDDMPALYALADLVLSASLEPEAFGRITVEGQAAGKPVIATAHGGALETVLADQSALLVYPGSPTDMAAGMAKAVSTLLALSPQSRMDWGKRGQTWVAANFSKEKMCQATLAVYQELAANKR